MGIVKHRKEGFYLGIFDKHSVRLFVLLICTILYMAGIQPGKADDDSLVRSSSLHELRTVDGNTERTDYLDDNGKITYAADKRYATVIKSRGDHSLLEEFYDENGEPARLAAGYYALLREYDEDGRESKTIYLDSNKQPVMISAGYASVIQTYNTEGKVETDHYYDIDSNPVQSKHDGYGTYRGYDTKGRNNLILHLDDKDEPMIAGNGYAALHRSFYEEGPAQNRIKDEYYYDTEEKPIRLSLGQYGLHKEYDELGRTSTLIYLDADGKPSPTTKGYTIIYRSFYKDDSVRTEMYYDAEGNPFRMPDGQYGILKQDGKTIYLNSAGRSLFEIRNQLNNNQMLIGLIILFVAIISSAGNRRFNAGLLVLCVLFIFYLTLIRKSDVRTGMNLTPFWSYLQFFSNDELRREIINNILLFIPFGILLYQLYPGKIILLVPIVLSVLIETIQYFLGLGLCELDDVISNGLGGMIGFAAGGLTAVLKSRIKKRASIYSL